MLKSLFFSMCLMALANHLHAQELTFVTEDFPPFSYASPDQQHKEKIHPAGPMVDIVRATCARLSIHCPITLLPWRRALSLADEGQIDGIFSVIDSPERQEQFYLTRMLVKSSYSVYSRKTNPFIYRQPSDLNGRTIGVYGPSGTSYMLSQTLSETTNAKIELQPNNRGLLRMLDSGRFGEQGLVVINQDVAQHLIQQEQLHNLQAVGTLAHISYAIGFTKNRASEASFREFDQALGDLIADGTISTILGHYNLQGAWTDARNVPNNPTKAAETH